MLTGGMPGQHGFLIGTCCEVLDVLQAVDEWLNKPQPSGGGHIAVHAALCPDLAQRVRKTLEVSRP